MCLIPLIAMRGEDQRSEVLFSYVRLESRIPADHPLRAIRTLIDEALNGLSRDFNKLYARDGRPSIPPERLLRALLLQAFYTVRSERQLMEQLNYNLLFRWFVGLSADDQVWNATVFCKNRDRLLDGNIAAKFFVSVLNLPQVRKLLSGEHFSVDSTLIEAWASMKSFVPKDGGDPPSGKGHGSGGRNAERNFHGEKRRNDTHFSTTDPDARLFRKGAGKGQTLPHGASDDGEPQWPHRRCAVDRGQRHSRALDRARHDRGQCQARQHRGRRQELRHRRLCRRLPRTRLYAACLAEQCQPPLRDRRAHDPPSRLSHQHDQAQADRRALWLDEDRRRSAQDPVSWARLGGMVLRADCCRLQSRSRPQASGRNGMSPSGASNMRQNRNQLRLCSADRDPSLRFFDPQTSRKTLQN